MPLLSPSDTAFAEHWHALDSAEVLRRCGTDPAVGLSADLAAQRLVERGANALPEPPPRPLWRTFLRQFKSPLIYILFAAAALTGESVPVSKSVQGVPQAAGLTEQAEEPRTPLELRLEQFGRALVGAALGLFVLVVLLGLWRALPLPEVLMVAISQMVSMVPEGLPVAMTIALAVGMQRMAGRGAIIRRLSAVETLGSTTVICSDKTGTLTRNEMTVTRLWLPPQATGAARTLEVEGTGYAPQGRLLEAGQPAHAVDAALRPVLEAAVLCNDAELLAPEDERSGWTVLGDPTEGALLVLAAKAGLDPAALRRQAPRLAELPFDSDNKLMATCHGSGDVWVKGAPEAVLRLCARDDARMSAQAREQAREMAREMAEWMAGQALRVLAVAEVPGAALDAQTGFDALAGRARLLGLIGQIDPPREEVKLAVAECRRAGIRPVMVTGDHKLTGLAIARELGIAREGDQAVDGPELERMGEAELRDALPGIAVFARVQPAQKLRIVEALQARGEVVAMTGDGVNDAPALARADVGVAMGITGTEVAKSAAKIVVTDDNFATIVGAVQQGRVVYGNLKKVILYLFATSMAEVLVLLLALALALALLGGFPLPLVLLASAVLWVEDLRKLWVRRGLVPRTPAAA